jgi:hypothetical protein
LHLHQRKCSYTRGRRHPATTADGYHTKIEVIRKAEFDDEVLLGIMFLLGRDAERLGIADDPPDLRSDW